VAALEGFVLHAVFVVLAAAQFALDLNVRTLLQAGGKFGEFSESDAAVPFGPRLPFVLCVLLGTLRGHREDGDAQIHDGGCRAEK